MHSTYIYIHIIYIYNVIYGNGINAAAAATASRWVSALTGGGGGPRGCAVAA